MVWGQEHQPEMDAVHAHSVIRAAQDLSKAVDALLWNSSSDEESLAAVNQRFKNILNQTGL